MRSIAEDLILATLEGRETKLSFDRTTRLQIRRQKLAHVPAGPAAWAKWNVHMQHRGWISPEGTLHRLGPMDGGHSKWLYNHHGIACDNHLKNPVMFGDCEHCHHAAAAKGWIRKVLPTSYNTDGSPEQEHRVIRHFREYHKDLLYSGGGARIEIASPHGSKFIDPTYGEEVDEALTLARGAISGWGHQQYQFYIHHEVHGRVGALAGKLSTDKKDFRVDAISSWIDANPKSSQPGSRKHGPWSFGVANVRTLTRELKRHFPTLQTISTTSRITGGREKAFGFDVPPSHQHIKRRLTAEELVAMHLSEMSEGTDIKVRHRTKRDGGVYVYAQHPTMKNALGGPLDVGHVYIPPDYQRPTHWTVGDAYVHDDLRRQGIATKMYDYVEKKFKVQLKPGPYQSPDAKAFWSSRSRTESVEEGLSVVHVKSHPECDQCTDIQSGYGEPEDHTSDHWSVRKGKKEIGHMVGGILGTVPGTVHHQTYSVDMLKMEPGHFPPSKLLIQRVRQKHPQVKYVMGMRATGRHQDLVTRRV